MGDIRTKRGNLRGGQRLTMDQFLSSEWRDGGLQGVIAHDTFFVKWDRTTMTETISITVD